MNRSARLEPVPFLDLARAGDGAALGQLLERYRNYLTLLARLQIGGRLQSKLDASDLVQETFLEAHRDFGHFQGTTEKELIHWLRQVLVSNLTDLVRRYTATRQRDVRLEQSLAAELEQSSELLDRGLIASQPSPSEQAARREQAVLLADALQRLPEDYREVIILVHLQGLSFPEASRRMNRSLDSVKKLRARALAGLHRILGGSQ
jgi:RNA polymerase sigma-70 factor (ECF subfamily)